MNQRYVFFDVLRGIAVLWMIQVHVTNVFLEPALRSESWFSVLNISNGFVAPAFIFCAGGGLWIALQRRGRDYMSWSPSLKKYLTRLTVVLLWGYALHFPVFAYGSFDLTAAQWATGLQIDVLHTIVYSSLATVALFAATRTINLFTWSALIVAIAISCVSVLIWQPNSGSPFPLFPWSAYLFAGAAFTGWFMMSDNKMKNARFVVVVGLLSPGLIFWIKDLPFATPWTQYWWETSPLSQLFRVSGIALAFGGLYLIESHLQRSRLGTWLQLIGQESLFLYVAHLLFLYPAGPIITKDVFGFEHVDPLGVIMIWAALTLPLVLVAKWRNERKKKK